MDLAFSVLKGPDLICNPLKKAVLRGSSTFEIEIKSRRHTFGRKSKVVAMFIDMLKEHLLPCLIYLTFPGVLPGLEACVP